MEEVRRSLRFDNCFTVDSVGSSGGIALLWKEGWKVEVTSFTRWHINARIKDDGGSTNWQFTGFYGHPDTMKRNSSWELLKILKPCPPIPWLCAGDFNEILHQREKVGRARMPYNQKENFRQALETCGIYDIHSKGQKFTWSNNMRGREFTNERIDRAMANKEWNELFNQAYYNIMAAVKSDHSPLHVNLQHIEYGRGRRNKVFRYKAAWELKEDCGDVVKEA